MGHPCVVQKYLLPTSKKQAAQNQHEANAAISFQPRIGARMSFEWDEAKSGIKRPIDAKRPVGVSADNEVLVKEREE